ncbi:MAG: hypothetical protein FJZ97_09845 [Chloroflexi bacterium]|nr:hypothetical protein [Chloroflexota bacterium]
MTVLAVVVVLSWMWMMATSLHFDDARTEVRRPTRLAPPRADLASALGLRGRLRQRPQPVGRSTDLSLQAHD